MADRAESGVLDTCTYIDIAELDPASLPAVPEITAITMAELHQGVAIAGDPVTRAARTEMWARPSLPSTRFTSTPRLRHAMAPWSR